MRWTPTAHNARPVQQERSKQEHLTFPRQTAVLAFLAPTARQLAKLPVPVARRVRSAGQLQARPASIARPAPTQLLGQGIAQPATSMRILQLEVLQMDACAAPIMRETVSTTVTSVALRTGVSLVPARPTTLEIPETLEVAKCVLTTHFLGLAARVRGNVHARQVIGGRRNMTTIPTQKPMSAEHALQTLCQRQEVHQSGTANVTLVFLLCGDTKCHAKPAHLQARHPLEVNHRVLVCVTPDTAWKIQISDDAPPLQTCPNYLGQCLHGTMIWVTLPCILVKHALPWTCRPTGATVMDTMAQPMPAALVLKTPYL